MTFIFRNRTIFWDISKWNRGQKKWDGGSNTYCKIFNSKNKSKLIINIIINIMSEIVIVSLNTIGL